jgi:hypothetical protein
MFVIAQIDVPASDATIVPDHRFDSLWHQQQQQHSHCQHQQRSS